MDRRWHGRGQIGRFACGCAPAFGRVEGPAARVVYGMAEAVPIQRRADCSDAALMFSGGAEAVRLRLLLSLALVALLYVGPSALGLLGSMYLGLRPRL